MNFKTKPIGEFTAAVMLAQGQEMQWKGAIIIGILADKDPEGRIKVGFNHAGLSEVEVAFLTAKLSAMVSTMLATHRDERHL